MSPRLPPEAKRRVSLTLLRNYINREWRPGTYGHSVAQRILREAEQIARDEEKAEILVLQQRFLP